MIFLCFSGRARHTIVKSIRFHLENYGLNLWYDNHRYILGDEKKTALNSAINSSNYAVIVICEDFFNSPGALEELEIVEKRYLDNSITIFPIFYKTKATELPVSYQWLNELIYNELDESTGSLLTCNQILSKYLTDIIANSNYFTFNDIITKREYCSLVGIPTYFNVINELLTTYDNICHSNLNSRMAILYSIYILLIEYSQSFCPKPLQKVLSKSTKYIFSSYKFELSHDFKEILIFEDIIAILLNIILDHSQ